MVVVDVDVQLVLGSAAVTSTTYVRGDKRLPSRLVTSTKNVELVALGVNVPPPTTRDV